MNFSISGLARSGKDTFADRLMQIRGNVVRASFAAPLKEYASNFFGWNGEKDPKGRRLLQLLGTEVGRHWRDNIWLIKASARYSLEMPKGNNELPIMRLQLDERVSLLHKVLTQTVIKRDRDFASIVMGKIERLFNLQIPVATKARFSSYERELNLLRKAKAIALAGFGATDIVDLVEGSKEEALINGILTIGMEYDAGGFSCTAVDGERLVALLKEDHEFEQKKKLKYHQNVARDEKQGPIVIFTDTRFRNEMDILRHNGFATVYVTRTGIVPMGHQSETEMLEMEYDFRIENNASLEDYFRKVDIVIDEVEASSLATTQSVS